MPKDIDLIYQQTAMIEPKEIKAGQEALKDYVDFVFKVASEVNYDYNESSINLSQDDNFKNYVLAKVQQWKNPELKYIVVVGIGGSNIGTMAVYRALRGRLEVFMGQNVPKIIFVDTVSPPLINQVVKFLEGQVSSPAEVLVNMISKSGTTLESVANFEVVYEVLKKKFGEAIDQRLIFTTDRDTKLWTKAEEKKLELLEIPQAVNGRYSILSSVGMFPLGLAGFNPQLFWDGASRMVKRCVTRNDQNPAMISAILTYMHYAKGLNIYNNFYFNPELKSLGKWHSQLLAEGVGKEYNLNKQKVNLGITPMVTIGSTDLHSIAQLCLAGPKDKFTQFVHAAQKDGSPVVPKELFLPDLDPNIAGKSIADIVGAIYYGIKIAYLKNSLPFSEIIMSDISEDSLGQYMQLKMIETMYLARLMGVNAFDQPKVEDYKREAVEYLKKL